jgi:hypothetical protein
MRNRQKRNGFFRTSMPRRSRKPSEESLSGCASGKWVTNEDDPVLLLVKHHEFLVAFSCKGRWSPQSPRISRTGVSSWCSIMAGIRTRLAVSGQKGSRHRSGTARHRSNRSSVHLHPIAPALCEDMGIRFLDLPDRGAEMKLVSFIEGRRVVERILRQIAGRTLARSALRRARLRTLLRRFAGGRIGGRRLPALLSSQREIAKNRQGNC